AIPRLAGWLSRPGATAWRRLHRLAYVAGVLAALPFLWLSKVGRQEPYWYAGWLALALGIRLWDTARRVVARQRRRHAETLPSGSPGSAGPPPRPLPPRAGGGKEPPPPPA